MNQHADAVARNLKTIRESRSLSLDQLSELTGVSKSMLRQIETGRSSPTIATIWKIANGLRLSFTALLKRQDPDVHVMDFKGEEPLTARSAHYRLFPLIPFDPQNAFEVYYFEMDGKVTFDGEPHSGDTEEYVFVTRGHVSIAVEGRRHTAGRDQCIRFMADCPHTYMNPGKEVATGLMLICYHS